MGIHEYDSDTGIYSAALQYPIHSGMQVIVQGVPMIQNIEIPITVTSYTGPSRKPTPQNIAILPGVDDVTGAAFGGVAVGQGSNSLPRASYEGFIDTPFVLTNNLALPDLLVNGNPMHYASLIIAYLEGRASTQVVTSALGVPQSSGWNRTDPNWFRDPYGRQYNTPKISDFTAQFVEGAPERTNITLELIL